MLKRVVGFPGGLQSRRTYPLFPRPLINFFSENRGPLDLPKGSPSVFQPAVLGPAVLNFSDIYCPRHFRIELSPAEENEGKGFRLLKQAGYISQTGSGIFSLLPLAQRTVQNICNVIDHHLQSRGAQKLQMPILQPRSIWEQSGRWDLMGSEMMRFSDRKGSEFCLGPTHEEIVAHLASPYLQSYRQLPLIIYQIGTKFRDETRPKFGLLRAREFVMKDAYSFDLDKQAAVETYGRIRAAYVDIFSHLQLDTVIADADTGAMGGNLSEEFHVLANVGEDTIISCPSCKYTSNVEKAEGIAQISPSTQKTSALFGITPSLIRSDDGERFAHLRSAFHKVLLSELQDTENCDLSLEIFRWELYNPSPTSANQRQSVYAALVKDAHRETNLLSISKKLGLSSPENLSLHSIRSGQQKIWMMEALVNSNVLLVDHSLIGIQENLKTFDHQKQLNLLTGAFTKLKTGDICSSETCKSQYSQAKECNKQEAEATPNRFIVMKGIEVGQIFHLGTKYSEKFGVKVDNARGKEITVEMGCYGLGVTRILSALIEQHSDAKGIIWPDCVAPFRAVLVSVPPSSRREREHQESVERRAEKFEGLVKAILQSPANLRHSPLHGQLLLDNRSSLSFGAKMNEVELVGIPYIIIAGSAYFRGESPHVEIKVRKTGQSLSLLPSDIPAFFAERFP